MDRYNWDTLNSLQVGKYAEYFVKMEFTMLGYDVYTSEVDDKGIDFVIRKNINGSTKETNRYYDVQVKSIRNCKTKYVFMPKDKFDVDDNNLLLALVVFVNGLPPELFLIPAREWKNKNCLLVGYDYEGKKSAPEWGISITNKSMSILRNYSFDKTIIGI
jgi:hypothetical protein